MFGRAFKYCLRQVIVWRRAAVCVGVLVALVVSMSDGAMAARRQKTEKQGQAPATEQPADQPTGPVRRAFVVGIDTYDDRGIQKLERPVRDADGIAKDLEDVGFDQKNIKKANNIRTKADFLKAFNDFLKDVKADDQLFFFFSGHGFGSINDDRNYLLFGNTRTLVSFTKERLIKDGTPKERTNDPAFVRLKLHDYETNYEIDEIQANGLSDQELEDMIAAKQPGAAILVLDACRTLTSAEDNEGIAYLPTGLHTHQHQKLPSGLAVLYSASEGEAAIESLGYSDHRANSLFTDVFRLSMKRPGVDFKTLASQISTQVSAVAQRYRLHQTPELVESLKNDFRFVPSVGAERFPPPFDADPCAFAERDLAAAIKAQTIDALVNHLDQFRGCKTIEEAQLKLADARKKETTNLKPPIDTRDCDDLAASPYDPSRPASKPGVPFEQIGKKLPVPGEVRQPGEPDEFDTQHVVDVCQEAVKANPRILRYALNLAQAEQAQAQNIAMPIEVRREYMERARLDYQRLADAGEVLAMSNLAAIYMNPPDPRLDKQDRSGIEPPKVAVALIKKAAQQGLPYAEYQLGNMYALGYPEGGVKVDRDEARQWLGLAAKASIVGALELEAWYELNTWIYGRYDGANPVLAADLYRRAVRAGSVYAARRLGMLYFNGREMDPGLDKTYVELGAAVGRLHGSDAEAKKAEAQARYDQVKNLSIAQDDDQALLWFARAAAKGDAFSSYLMYFMLEHGRGVKEPEQELAGRYLRASAEAGYVDAQVQYVEKIIDGSIILRFEDREATIDRLLKRAVKAGNGKAALMLAKRAWPDNLQAPRDAARAAAFAFMAIDLAARVDPSNEIFSNEFSPLTEMAAGHFLVKLGHDPSALDANGQAIIHSDELATLEKYYGTYDKDQKQVKVKIAEIYDYSAYNLNTTYLRKQIWIWDWGREEPPTEMQFRDLELDRGTPYWDWQRDLGNQTSRRTPDQLKKNPDLVSQNMLRGAIADVYKLSKGYGESFLSLLENKVEILSGN